MNRRDFLKLTFQGPVFLPHLANGLPVIRFAIIADTQMAQAEIAEIFPLLQARPVEFFIVAGDVVGLNPGNNEEPVSQWEWTIDRLNSLGKPWLAVSGNHDWGTFWNKPISFGPRQDAIDAWGVYVGARQWVKELEYTRIVGVDFFDWTAANQNWIAVQLATTKRKIVVSHFPLTGCQAKWYELWDWQDWYSQEKLAFFEAHGVDLFLCGHRHQFSLAQVGTMKHIICPSIAPVAGNNLPEGAPDGLAPMTYPMRGWLEIVETAAGLTVELWRSDGVMVWGFIV